MSALISTRGDASTFTMLATFTGPNGSVPRAGLTFDSAGNLWGTTDIGGATVSPSSPVSGLGTVFKLAPDGTITTVHSFTGADGSSPRSTLIRHADGSLYGTASASYTGSYSGSSVFKISSQGVFSTVAQLTPAIGMAPRGGLIADEAGNLYGTASAMGAGGFGSVFKVAADGSVTALASFNRTNGASPYGSLVRDAAGNLYGTTRDGGANNAGTVFKLSSTGTLTTLASFGGMNGSAPESELLLDAEGDLYGTTSETSTIFKVDSQGQFSTVARLTPSIGSILRAGLISDIGGNLYGTAQSGGGNGSGSVFKMTPNGSLSIVYSFIGGTAGGGYRPVGKLLAHAQGNLYGTTTAGGTSIVGTVFKLSDTGYISVVADTDGDNRVNFDDLLTLAQNYGATSGMLWEQGDFTRDGAVNFDDLLILAQHYDANAQSAAIAGDATFQSEWQLARSLAPEPTAVSLACGLTLVRRRR